MAKKKPEPVDDLVTVIAGAHFKHDGQDIRPRQVVQMSQAEAADLLALRFVYLPKPEEPAR